MGPICDRSREHLGTTDRAVIAARQLLLEACDDVEAGRDPRGTDPATYRNARAADKLVPKNADWRASLARDLTARF
jgi:phthalate 4,5-dioxygenase oxygenase subunit